MLTAFARFGEHAAMIARLQGTEGRKRAVEGAGGDGGAIGPQPDNVYPADAAGAGLHAYLAAAILLINSSTRQLSCSFS
jgi:hypothetical protein